MTLGQGTIFIAHHSFFVFEYIFSSECSSSMEYCDPSQPANKGTEVWCIRNGKDSPTVDALAGVIVGVHRDTPIEPYYYSVRLPLPDGNDFEIQTTSSR